MNFAQVVDASGRIPCDAAERLKGEPKGVCAARITLRQWNAKTQHLETLLQGPLDLATISMLGRKPVAV